MSTTFKKYINESHNFKIGDRVVGLGEVNDVDLTGEKGTVKDIYGYIIGDYVGVEWDRSIDDISDGYTNGHTCNGGCKKGHGWDVNIKQIKKISSSSKHLKQLKFD